MMESDISKRILKRCRAQHVEMLTFLERLVLSESPTMDPAAQKAPLDALREQLEAVDYHVMHVPRKHSGGYLLARPARREKGKAIQMMVGHCDTVWPHDTLFSMPFKRVNGTLKGPGVFDMKAGLTQIVFALKTLKSLGLATPFVPVVFVNSDEEKGSHDSRDAVARLAKIAQRAFILEPPYGLEGKLKTARKGIGRFTLTVTGKPAHAGLDPTKGASAILELSHQIQQLFALNDPLNGISVNVGMIEGGVNANVVAPVSKAVIDVRFPTPENGAWIEDKIRGLRPKNPETVIHIHGNVGPPLVRNERNQQLWHRAKLAGEQLGLQLDEAIAGGGSDGNTTSLYTATLDGLGTPGDGAHARHEFIFPEKIIERTALLTLLLTMP